MGYSSTPRWVLIALLVIAGKSLKEASYSELEIPSSFVCLPFYEAELVFFLVFRTKRYNKNYCAFQFSNLTILTKSLQ